MVSTEGKNKAGKGYLKMYKTWVARESLFKKMTLTHDLKPWVSRVRAFQKRE